MSGIKSTAFGIAGVATGMVLSTLIVTPTANADDDLGNLRARVNGDRARSVCTPLKYNQKLQDIGFAQGQFIPLPADQINGMIGSYGEVAPFIGVGDPIAKATQDAFNKGAGGAIADCHWTEFGVSFTRYEPTETDWVGLIFGRPATVTPPSGPGAPQGGQGGQGNPEPQKAATRQCPPGGPQASVPEGQTCPAPTNAISVSFDRGFAQWTVNVKNTAGIGGSCTYRATSSSGLTGASEDFDIQPNGTASFTVPAPLPLTSYTVVTTCTGTYDGQQVEFGKNTQTVP